ncbi:MAG: hypothetical protein ABI867_31945 [Kofleriaceae bacterium]
MTGCMVGEDLVEADDEPEISSTEQLLGSGPYLDSGIPIFNSFGYSTTVSTADRGRIDLTNPFFADLGTNDRRCVTCHLPTAGWTITPQQMQAIFALTLGGAFDDGLGLGAVFRTNDGSNSPNADVSTMKKRRAAYSMLLNRGTIRVGLPVPAGAQFELLAVDDPYGYASATELSLFRRPLPSTNLTLIPTVMWDGRVPGATVNDALADQANGATLGHAAALQPLTQDQRVQIVGLETGLFTAQAVTQGVGNVTAENGHGGATALTTQVFVASRFSLYDAWATSTNPARQAVFRGQELFNTRPREGTTAGTCRACHSAENSGTNKNGTFFNVGTSDASRRVADQPLYTFRNLATQEVLVTTDPGRALITGVWTDMNKFKVPSLRALAARAPYFHGGSAKTLAEVVKFYESSLLFNFTDAEEADLVAFLSTL